MTTIPPSFEVRRKMQLETLNRRIQTTRLHLDALVKQRDEILMGMEVDAIGPTSEVVDGFDRLEVALKG